MGARGHRAHLILFLVAVLAPCAVLIGLGVRIVRENREARWVRGAVARRQTAAEAQRALSSALTPILRDEVRTDLAPGQHYRHPETVLVAWAEGDKLTLPWDPERDQVARACRGWLSEPRFAAAVHACNQVKSRRGEAIRSTACYEQVIATADHPGQAAYARWLCARNLSEAGRPAEAAPLYRNLLRTAPEMTDEGGVPLSLLAAQALAREPANRSEVVTSVRSILAARPWLPPMSCYLANEIAGQLASDRNRNEWTAVEELVNHSAARVRLLQKAEGLQDSFASIRTLLRQRPPNSWAPYGDDPWLIGIAEPSANATAVLVLRGQDLVRRLAIPGAMRLAGSSDPDGESLGDSFPGVKLVLSNPLFDTASELQSNVLNSALILVVVATVFAAYLLWRDLRREMRLSELRTQFVSSVSHELKTPLTAIRIFAETLQMGRCADRETQEEYLGTIVKECERLSRLVDGVLLFSKAEQGKRIYRFKPMRAADAVGAAARALEYPLTQHGFRLHMDIRDDLPLVSADRDAIEQAVLNLLSNAMKYSKDARDIELGLFSENGDVVIRVADHGIGIAPEEHSRIFDKFYRAATKENQLIPGAGLGLALVAQIVNAHGGRVDVESAPGKGSTFLMRLPARPAEEGKEITI